MTECEKCAIELSAMIDGEATHPQSLSAIDHMLTCQPCRAFYQSARALQVRLHTPDALAPEPELWHRIAKQAGIKSHRPPAGWAPLLAAAIIVIGLGLGTFKIVDEVRQPPLESKLVEVELAGNRGLMTDRRFVDMAKELLESDLKYQQQMLALMQEIHITFPSYQTEYSRRDNEHGNGEDAERTADDTIVTNI